jgi:hypothetical protein
MRWDGPSVVASELVFPHGWRMPSRSCIAWTTLRTLQRAKCGSVARTASARHVADSRGTVLHCQDVIFNGPETWIVMTDHGQTRAIHTLGTTWNKPSNDPSSRGSLSDLLNAYGDKQCVGAPAVRRSGGRGSGHVRPIGRSITDYLFEVRGLAGGFASTTRQWAAVEQPA